MRLKIAPLQGWVDLPQKPNLPRPILPRPPPTIRRLLRGETSLPSFDIGRMLSHHPDLPPPPPRRSTATTPLLLHHPFVSIARPLLPLFRPHSPSSGGFTKACSSIRSPYPSLPSAPHPPSAACIALVSFVRPCIPRPVSAPAPPPSSAPRIGGLVVGSVVVAPAVVMAVVVAVPATSPHTRTGHQKGRRGSACCRQSRQDIGLL